MGGWTEGGKEPLKDGQIREGVIDSQVSGGAVKMASRREPAN